MKDTFFFPHDFGARNDPKLQNVLMEHGCNGLGVFWCIVEMIYEQGGSLPLSVCKSIAFALHVECKMVESVVNDFELFENDGENFWSESIKCRLNKRAEISEKRREAGKRGWQKTFGNYQSKDEQVIDKIKPSDSQNTNNETAKADYDNSICLAIKEKEIKEKEINNISIDIDMPENKFPGESKNQKKEKEIDFKKVVDMYHTLCPSFPRIVKLSNSRKQKIRIRLEEMNADFELLKNVFATMEKSKFLRGDNKNGWQATFDWIFENPKNWVKVIEGNYSDKKRGDKSKNVNDIWEK